ncbi:MAG: DUF1109 domain-containing protein [Caulobacteraceae bacterium]
MKTADLVAVLAAGAAPTPPLAAGRRLALAGLAGAGVATLLLVVWLGHRPLAQAAQTGPFWMKAGYTVVLAAAALAVVRRLARPGGRLGNGSLIVAAIAVAIMAGLAAIEVARAQPGDLANLWLGHTWKACSLHILALAAPIFLALAWALRSLAPTRLALAGAAAGALAGAAGATVYGLYCDETAAAFVVLWYTLGVAACATVGAALGPRLLRW